MKQLVEKYPALEACIPDIQHAYELLNETFRKGGKLLACGNGGSAADAEHIVGELMKGYVKKRPVPDWMRTKLLKSEPENGSYLADHLQGALPAISLVSQVALISAYANDVAADMVYAQQVYGYGCNEDSLIAFSTSGNSSNILTAVQVARAMGLHTIGLTGPSGGKLKSLCEVTICVPGDSTAAIQELHLPVIHTLCAMIELEFFP